VVLVGQILQHLRELGVHPLGAEFGRALEQFVEVAGSERVKTELGQEGLLEQPIGQDDLGRGDRVHGAALMVERRIGATPAWARGDPHGASSPAFRG